MLAFLSKHSSLFLVLASLIGFSFPTASSAALPFLPYILFALMVFTLLGINQKALVRAVADLAAWRYALVHCGLTTLVVAVVSIVFHASDAFILAATGVCATGTLFATPAIVRSMGFDPLKAMAYTITSTLMMPLALYINLTLFSHDSFSLDLLDYCIRLVIFIAGPMLFSFLVHRYVSDEKLSRIHSKLAQFTIVLVFSFPFGLSGQFRWLWDKDQSFALAMFGVAFLICVLFFVIGMLIYWRQGKEAAYIAAVTSGNRNVLLTYSVAGAYLGPLFLPLIGALQLPIYLQPVLVKMLIKKDMKQVGNV